MKQANFTPFQDLPEYRKGKIGEGILKADLERAGMLVYTAPQGMSEPFDFHVFKPDFSASYLVDCKTYNRLATIPAISIDLPDLEKYIKAEIGLRTKMLLYFIDTFEGAIYRCSLETFRNTCTKNTRNNKATTPLKEMTYIRALTLDECREIGYPTPMYNGVERWFIDSRIDQQTRR